MKRENEGEKCVCFFFSSNFLFAEIRFSRTDRNVYSTREILMENVRVFVRRLLVEIKVFRHVSVVKRGFFYFFLPNRQKYHSRLHELSSGDRRFCIRFFFLFTFTFCYLYAHFSSCMTYIYILINTLLMFAPFDVLPPRCSPFSRFCFVTIVITTKQNNMFNHHLLHYGTFCSIVYLCHLCEYTYCMYNVSAISFPLLKTTKQTYVQFKKKSTVAVLYILKSAHQLLLFTTERSAIHNVIGSSHNFEFKYKNYKI